MMEVLVPNWARPMKRVAASISTRVNPISSGVRKRVNTKKVVTTPTAMPR